MATTLVETRLSETQSTTNALAQALLAEFEAQAPVTRRFLERLPEDKLTWQPHPKSMTAGQLAYHIASVPGAIVRFVQNSPAQLSEFHFPQPATLAEILAAYDESIASVKSQLTSFDDAAMAETWRLQVGGREVLAVPRGKFLRDAMFSHWYQHRGQFGVYLRLLDIPVPSSFGPSADEPLPSMRKS